jgi:Flp pilus assembly protein TadD
MAPGESQALLNLAQIQDRSGAHESALENYQKAISLDPKSVQAVLAFANFYVRQKDTADAEKQFRAAIALEPQNPLPRASLAGLYVSEGRKDLAEQTMVQAKSDLANNPAGYAMLGEFYLAQGDLDKALAEYASLHSRHPKDEAISRTYAQALILKNQTDEASKIVDAILKDNPADPEGLILRGQIEIHQGHPDDAVQTLERATKEAPGNAVAHYQLGLAYAGTFHFAEAESQWRQSSKIQPRLPEPKRALANLAMRKGDAAMLAEVSADLIKIEPNSTEGYIFHALALFNTGNAAGAESDLNHAIAIAPQNPAGYARMGDMRMAQKKYAEAEKLYIQALTLNPSANDALNGLANIYLIQKQPAKALQIVETQISRVPNNSNFYTLLGQVELRSQDPTKAVAAFEKATELDKNNVPAFLLLASAQASLGSVDQAIAAYQTALQNNPRDLRLYIAQGTLLETRGDWEKARDLYLKALQIQPDYPLAANNLAYIMLEHGGNSDVALTYAQTARRGLPDSPYTADTLAWAYYKKGIYASAVDLLEEAIKDNPNSATYQYHLGMTYTGMHDFTNAKLHLQEALKISPNYAKADEIRKILAQGSSGS